MRSLTTRENGPRLLLFLTLLCGASGALAVEPAQVRELVSRRPVVVSWRARTHAAGVSFVVLRGDSLDSLVRVGQVEAVRGEEGYRFVDREILLHDTVIQLLAVDAGGRATVLETVLCRPRSDLVPLPGTGPGSAPLLFADASVPPKLIAPRPKIEPFAGAGDDPLPLHDRTIEDPPPERFAGVARG